MKKHDASDKCYKVEVFSKECDKNIDYIKIIRDNVDDNGMIDRKTIIKTYGKSKQDKKYIGYMMKKYGDSIKLYGKDWYEWNCSSESDKKDITVFSLLVEYLKYMISTETKKVKNVLIVKKDKCDDSECMKFNPSTARCTFV